MTGPDAPLIRPATPLDEAAIRACARAAYSGYDADVGREPAPMSADFLGHIAAREVWVAERGGVFLGYVIFYPVEGAMFLDSVAVVPDTAGQGIGRRLIAACEEAARRLGLPAVRLYTNAKMTANLTLYPHLGYVRTGRRLDEGFDRVFFEKRLG